MEVGVEGKQVDRRVETGEVGTMVDNKVDKVDKGGRNPNPTAGGV